LPTPETSKSSQKSMPINCDPMVLLKAILIQKWFGINFDPDLESQINERFSFKAFIGLPFGQLSPDHSIICRFQERTGKDTWEKVHHELLNQFDTPGSSIESGMVLDARVVKAASHSVSDKKLKTLREKRNRLVSKSRDKIENTLNYAKLLLLHCLRHYVIST
jgi:IS5 family transposase